MFANCFSLFLNTDKIRIPPFRYNNKKKDKYRPLRNSSAISSTTAQLDFTAFSKSIEIVEEKSTSIKSTNLFYWKNRDPPT